MPLFLCYTFYMIISNNTPLQILLPNDNKLIKEALKHADIRQLLESQKGITLKDILSNIFNSLKTESKSNEAIFNLLKNSTLFKELGNFNSNLTQLLNLLPQDGKLGGLKGSLSATLLQANQLTPASLQQQLQQSGIFLENRLSNDLSAKNIALLMQNDTKALLLQVFEQVSKEGSQELLKQTERLLTQIDYYQLLSLSSSSTHIYIPFLWDLLEEGSIQVKQTKESCFYCQIELTLKELGEINLHLYLFDDKNLELSIFIEKEQTKSLLLEELPKLRKALSNNQITSESIKLFMMEQESGQQNLQDKFNATNEQLSLGLNIKV